ncbi:MAG: hypothetical protein WC291_06560 [Thermodesulfovibrionales bacterium]|jgi:predicted RNase H-like HicB family nuclease
MNELPYSLVIKATEKPGLYRFSSPDLRALSGTGYSVDDCVRSAKRGIMEYMNLLRDQGLPVPPPNPSARIIL